ncbi:hypothetical protein NDU88_005372 [Pleurodeles waltl]|uniref:Uncharacterized protein n=1 Tax=Pleurodeles waltl TaxID=8319 RepID=A0AAV7NQ41_PLEWA|nr:hypothetical protein NDU88_005372 [Pleurodeles waltl]
MDLANVRRQISLCVNGTRPEHQYTSSHSGLSFASIAPPDLSHDPATSTCSIVFKCAPQASPTISPPGHAVQALKARPHSPDAAREGTQSWRRKGGPVVRHHSRYGPPQSTPMITASGHPGPRGNNAGQSRSTWRPGARLDLKVAARPLAPHRNCRRCNRGKPSASGDPPTPSHRSASSVLTGEFSKLGPLLEQSLTECRPSCRWLAPPPTTLVFKLPCLETPHRPLAGSPRTEN